MNDIGFFDIVISGFQKSEQNYLRNTTVLSTKLYGIDGSIEIIDFIPRFKTYDREYRPNMLLRILKPLKGRPRIQIRLRPTFGYGWGTPEKTRGSNHIRYILSNMTIRLTTNTPIAYIIDESLFEVDETLYLILMPDESLKSSISEMADNYFQKTIEYWRTWIKTLSLPLEWQEEVIRACITLKMSSFEETGAIVAAMTTSIPNTPEPSLNTNHDYRYCWLRDALSVVRVLNQVGATNTMEGYLNFLSNVVAAFAQSQNEHEIQKIQSVYGISLETRLYERQMHRLPGYRGMGPVVLGSKDCEKIQNDVYGSVILGLTQIFFDKRLNMEGTDVLFKKLELIGEHTLKIYNQPDLSLRSNSEEPSEIHTFSSVMCWAACDRLATISQKLKLDERYKYWKMNANKMKAEILEKCWNNNLKSFVNTWNGNQVDAYLLLLPELKFIHPLDEKFLSTLKVIENLLKKGDYILCFPNDSTSLNSATFWYIMSLASVGRKDEARKLFENMLKTLNSNGILSETVDLKTKELWGNFPQNTAMVGLIQCAIRLSKSWEEVY
jgi:GH15 family glucan-1,4-alpha-glucosidase